MTTSAGILHNLAILTRYPHIKYNVGAFKLRSKQSPTLRPYKNIQAHPSSSTIISRRSFPLIRRFSSPSSRSDRTYLGVSYPFESSPSSSKRNSLNEARADISLSRIPIRSPSGDGYAAGVDGIESGVSACAGVDGVDDKPGNDCRSRALGDVVWSNGSSGAGCCRWTPIIRSRSTHLQSQVDMKTPNIEQGHYLRVCAIQTFFHDTRHATHHIQTLGCERQDMLSCPRRRTRCRTGHTCTRRGKWR